jgi:two-component system, chemotaxis family, chemotaxis protein CheY
MRTLIVDDDFTNRLLLQEILNVYGPTHVAINGKEAVEAVRIAQEATEPYDLICLDIMMPEMDGQDALHAIRTNEEKVGVQTGNGVKVIMTTALSDSKNVLKSFKEQCDAYVVKPINKAKLLDEVRKLELIN